MVKERIVDIYSLEELLVLANKGLKGNTGTKQFQKVTGCEFSYSGVTKCLKDAGCERLWVTKQTIELYQNKVNEIKPGCSNDEYRDKIRNLEMDLCKEDEARLQKAKPLSINLSGEYDKSRHSFTIDEGGVPNVGVFF